MLKLGTQPVLILGQFEPPHFAFVQVRLPPETLGRPVSEGKDDVRDSISIGRVVYFNAR